MSNFPELSVLLQRERLLMELLVFKLTELGHLLAAGDARFLGWAAEEVERAIEAVRMTELERAVHVQDLADRVLGRHSPDAATLVEQLAAKAPEPTASALRAHGAALQELVAEVAAGLSTARRLAEFGATAVSALLDRVGAPAAPEPALLTYGPDSTSAWTAPAPRLRTTL